MKIGPKYKIARRLGAPVFSKTQTQKFALSQERKQKNTRMRRPKTNFASQMLEKQKARYTYGISEKQFSRYVKSAMATRTDTSNDLFVKLERRLDNIVFRTGLANSRLFARQMVSHGHITVNGVKVSIPSYGVKKGDVVAVREGSRTKKLFANIEERLKNHIVPSWITFNNAKLEGSVISEPKYIPADSMFDLNAVIEFYSR